MNPEQKRQADRLAAALRDNLAKRKAQARERENLEKADSADGKQTPSD